MIERRTTTTGAAFVIVALACGCADSGPEQERSAVRTTSVTTPVTAPSSAPTRPSTPASTPPPFVASSVPTSVPSSQPDDPAAARSTGHPDLLDLIQQPPEPDGWVVPAGTWQSSAFDPAVTFQTTRELRLLDEGPATVRLALPGTGTDARITILTPLASGSDDVTPTAPTDDLATTLAAIESVDVERTETDIAADGGTFQWADFRARRADGFSTYPCDLGWECIWILRTIANANVDVIERAPIRLTSLRVGGVPMRVLVSASDAAEFDAVAEQALAITRSLAVADDSAAAPPGGDRAERTFLSMVGTRSTTIPAGIHATLVGGTVVELRLDEPLPDTAIEQAFPATVALAVGDLGLVYVIDPLGYVDPDIDQPRPGDPAVESLLDPDDIDVVDWFAAMYDRVTPEPIEIAGVAATKLLDEHTELRTDRSWPCTVPTGEAGRCVSVYASAAGWWQDADVWPTAEVYLLDRSGLLVIVGPKTGADVAAFEARAAELLEHLVVVE